MIRPDLMRVVLQALKFHRTLSQDDFIVREFDDRGSPCLSIVYRYDATLFFRFKIPTSRTTTHEGSSLEYRFQGDLQPGCEAVEETFSAAGRNELVDGLKEWMDRLYQDVASVPVVRQFQEQFKEHERAIHQLAARLDVLPDEPISRADVEIFSEGLEKLRAEILTRLEKECDDKKSLADRVDALSNDIAFLKQTLESMTTRNWGKLLVSRTNKWQIAYMAMKLLGAGEPGEVVESITQVIDSISDAADH